MAAIHIPNSSICSISLGTGEGRAYFAGLDHSIHELILSGQPLDGTAPVERVLTDPGKARTGSPFAAVTWGTEIRVYYISAQGFLQELATSADGGNWYDGDLNQLQLKPDQNLQWLYAMKVADDPVIRVGFTRDGDNGQIEEAAWRSVKSSAPAWHFESFVQQGQ